MGNEKQQTCQREERRFKSKFLNNKWTLPKKNEDYSRISSFLNPNWPIELGFFHRLGFLTQALQLIFKNGMEPLRKAILAGQYTENKGLYFGGTQADELEPHIDQLFSQDLIRYQKIIWIDLHTGYGERGQLHLLANDSRASSSPLLQKMFPNKKIDFGDQKNFYKTDGDMVTYLNLKSTPARPVLAIAFEYGTMDSQKTLGSVESLRRMVIENQLYQNGATDSSAEIEVRRLFKEMFFPQDENWKLTIFEQTENTLEPLMESTP